MKTVHVKRNRTYTRRSASNPKHKVRNGVPVVTEILPFPIEQEKYLQLKKYLVELYMINLAAWPGRKPRKNFPGIPNFIVEVKPHQRFIIIRFRQTIILPDGRSGSFFRIGGSSKIIELF